MGLTGPGNPLDITAIGWRTCSTARRAGFHQSLSAVNGDLCDGIARPGVDLGGLRMDAEAVPPEGRSVWLWLRPTVVACLTALAAIFGILLLPNQPPTDNIGQPRIDVYSDQPGLRSALAGPVQRARRGAAASAAASLRNAAEAVFPAGKRLRVNPQPGPRDH
jgi:hypothetical protein